MPSTVCSSQAHSLHDGIKKLDSIKIKSFKVGKCIIYLVVFNQQSNKELEEGMKTVNNDKKAPVQMN